MRSFALGLLVGAVAGAVGAVLVSADVATPTLGSESIAALLGAVAGGAISFVSASGMEYAKRRSSEKAHISIILRFVLNVAMDLGIAHALVQECASSGETHVDPADPRIAHVRNALKEDMGEARRLAESAGIYAPRALRDLLILDAYLSPLIRVFGSKTPLDKAQEIIDDATRRIRRLDRLASRA